MSETRISGDTIAALASGAGRAGVAVIRVSGPDAAGTIAHLSGRGPPPARRAVLRRLAGADGDTLDHVLVLWMPGPDSFTGEDVAEFHVHGGPAIIAAVLRRLCDHQGVRPAGPGEFTRRAFDAGRLDLAEVEGLADLIDAETEVQRRQAMRQFEGALGVLVAGWRDRLIEISALIEAEIDFPDEDLPDRLALTAGDALAALRGELRSVIAEADRGARVREGVRVVILGAPNAGKSTLLNALAGREAAIVSPIAGTTRDVLEIRLVLAGLPVWVADTAGLRASDDLIEQEGVRRALERADEADLRVLVVDASGDHLPAHGLERMRGGDILVLNKADLPAGQARDQALARANAQDWVWIESAPDIGRDALAEAIARAVSLVAPGPALVTRQRQRDALVRAAEALDRAASGLTGPPELAAEDIRLAIRALEQITGKVGVEDILGRIFSTFCIGK